MLLIGIVVGQRWHPARIPPGAIAVAAGGFTMIQEIVSCFVRRSITVWWIGRRMGELKGGS